MFRTLETELSSLRMYSRAKNKNVSLSSESISATKVPFWQSIEKKKRKKKKERGSGIFEISKNQDT